MPKVRANGTLIEYDVTGPEDGTPFLLIHGFSSQMTAWPDAFRDRLVEAGLRFIRFDNRDVGLSQKWDGIQVDISGIAKALREGKMPPVPYTLAEMADDAAGLLDGLGIASAHIAGASMGGMIAQLVALNHRAKARSLIAIYSTTSDRSLPRSSPEAQAALVSRPPSAERGAVVAHALRSRRAYASTAFPFDEARLATVIGANYDRSYYPEGAARHYAAILATPPRAERLKALDLPTLVLHGSADTLIPPEGGRHIAQCVPGAEYHEIEGWGHDMPPEAIPLVTGFILPFVAKVEAARR